MSADPFELMREWSTRRKVPENSVVVDEYSVEVFRVRILRTPYGMLYDVDLPTPTESELKLLDRIYREFLSPRARQFSELLELRGRKIRDVIREWARLEVEEFGVLSIIMRDRYVEDIQAVRYDWPLKVVHSRYRYLLTTFTLSKSYIERVAKALEKAGGVTITLRRPFASFQVRNVRVSITKESEVSPYTTITIRKPLVPWNLGLFVKMNVLPVEDATLLWLALLAKVPILVIGEMGAGKTSMISAIMSTVPKDYTVVLIEDQPEIQTPWPVIRLITRDAPDPSARITAFDLLVQALRESADIVIVGEVRGEEASAWGQAILLGHGGLCLPRDQLVLAKVDGRIDLYEIGEIVEGVLTGRYRDVEVLAVDERGNARWQKISRVVVKNGSKRFVRIHTKGGVVHEVHEDHPVVVYEDGRLVTKVAKMLREGDRLVALASLDVVEELEEIDVAEILREYEDKLYVYGISQQIDEIAESRVVQALGVPYAEVFDRVGQDKVVPLKYVNKLVELGYISKEDLRKCKILYGANARHGIPYFIKLDRNFGYVLGLFLAVGAITYDSRDGLPRCVVFYLENDPKKLEYVIETLIKIGIDRDVITTTRTPSEKVVALQINSKIFALLLYKLLDGRVRDYERVVPLDIALRAPQEFREGIVHGYWDGDGNDFIDQTGYRRIKATTVNRKLAESIALIMKTLGVVAGVRMNEESRTESKYDVIILGGENKRPFLKMLGLSAEIPTYSRIDMVGNLLLLPVEKIEIVEKDSLLYDIEVPETHMYAISGGLIVTHNTSLHGESPERALMRLMLPPLNVSPVCIDAIGVVVRMQKAFIGEKMVRVASVYSVEGVTVGKERIEPKVRSICVWDSIARQHVHTTRYLDTRLGSMIATRLGIPLTKLPRIVDVCSKALGMASEVAQLGEEPQAFNIRLYEALRNVVAEESDVRDYIPFLR